MEDQKQKLQINLRTDGDLKIQGAIAPDELDRLVAAAEYYRQLTHKLEQEKQEAEIKQSASLLNLLKDIGNLNGVAIMFVLMSFLFLSFGAYTATSTIIDNYTSWLNTQKHQY